MMKLYKGILRAEVGAGNDVDVIVWQVEADVFAPNVHEAFRIMQSAGNEHVDSLVFSADVPQVTEPGIKINRQVSVWSGFWRKSPLYGRTKPTVRDFENNSVVAPLRAPSAQKVREQEDQVTSQHARLMRECEQRRRVDQALRDRESADKIIVALSTMFAEGKVSSVYGARLNGIPCEMRRTSDTLTFVQEYLGDSWTAHWKVNTGNFHDEYVSDTLVIKPVLE